MNNLFPCHVTVIQLRKFQQNVVLFEHSIDRVENYLNYDVLCHHSHRSFRIIAVGFHDQSRFFFGTGKLKIVCILSQCQWVYLCSTETTRVCHCTSDFRLDGRPTVHGKVFFFRRFTVLTSTTNLQSNNILDVYHSDALWRTSSVSLFILFTGIDRRRDTNEF